MKIAQYNKFCNINLFLYSCQKRLSVYNVSQILIIQWQSWHIPLLILASSNGSRITWNYDTCPYHWRYQLHTYKGDRFLWKTVRRGEEKNIVYNIEVRNWSKIFITIKSCSWTSSAGGTWLVPGGSLKSDWSYEETIQAKLAASFNSMQKCTEPKQKNLRA